MKKIQVSSQRLSASPIDKQVLAYTFFESIDHNIKMSLDLAVDGYDLERIYNELYFSESNYTK